MRTSFVFRYAVVSLIAILGLLYLDGHAIFVYLSYVPSWLIVLGVAGGGLYEFGRVRRTRVEAAALVAISLLMMVAAIGMAFLPTSRRKAFILAADSLRPGMSLQEVRERMAPFDRSPFEKYSDSVTFAFESGPGTVDTVIVGLSTDHSTISTARLSLD